MLIFDEMNYKLTIKRARDAEQTKREPKRTNPSVVYDYSDMNNYINKIIPPFWRSPTGGGVLNSIILIFLI